MLVFAALLVSAVTAQTAWGQWTNSTASTSQFQPNYFGPDSCDEVTWRDGAFKKRWYNLAGPNSTGVPILSFRIANNDGNADTLFSFWVHSIAERTSTISALRLYRESSGFADTLAYYNAGDVLLQTVSVLVPFQTNDSVLVSGLTEIIAANDTNWYHLVVDMNAAGIGSNTTYDGTGVMVNIRPYRMYMAEAGGRDYGPNLPTDAPAGDTIKVACVPTSPANNAYSIIIDNQSPTCADLWIQNTAGTYNTFNDLFCSNACDQGESVISLGDSMVIDRKSVV